MTQFIPKYSFLFFIIGAFSMGCFGPQKSTNNHQVIRTEIEPENVLLVSLMKKSNEALLSADTYTMMGLDEKSAVGLESHIKNTEVIVQNEKDRVLYLPAIQNLDVASAKAIAEHAKHIYLNGLETLSPEVAKILLSAVPISLHLNGLQKIDQETASELGGFFGLTGTLGLNGLQEIAPEVAIGLGQIRNGTILLNGLRTIDAESANALAANRESKLSAHFIMNGLKSSQGTEE